MILKQMMSGLDAVLEHGSWDTEIKNIAYDSRKVEEGSLFVCIQGMAADGHTFIKEAVARGAVAVLVERFADATEQSSEGSFG